MPFAVPLIGAYAAGTLTSAMIGQAVISLAVSVALSAAAKKIGSKQSKKSGVLADNKRDRSISVRQAAAPRQVILGQATVGGTIVHMESVDSGAAVWMVIALADHEVEEIGDVWFGNYRIPASALEADGDTDSTVSRYYTLLGEEIGGPVYAPALRIKKHLGAADQAADPDLVAELPEWTSAHRLRGVAYIAVKARWNRGTPWPNGIPNIRATVKGAKLYDPRDAGTRWSANPALALLYLLTNDRFGMGVDLATEIDTTAFSAAANVCEEFVDVAPVSDAFTADASADTLTRETYEAPLRLGDRCRLTSTGTLPAGLAEATDYYAIPLGDPGEDARPARLQVASSYANALAGTAIDITDAGTGTHTLQREGEVRYALGGAFDEDLANGLRPVLQNLLAAMAGTLGNAGGGTWSVAPGAYVAPSVELGLGDAAGPIDVATGLTIREKINRAKGTYRDPLKFDEESDFPAVTNATYLAEDGDELKWGEFDFEFVPSAGQAQRLAKIELEESRQGYTVTLPVNLKALQLKAGSTVAVTNDKWGWSSKPFRVTRWAWAMGQGENPAMTIEVTLRETASGVYDWNSGEETTVDLAPNTNLPNPWEVPAPGVPVVTEDLYTTRDKQVKAKAIMTWPASTGGMVTGYDAEAKLSSDTTWSRLVTDGQELTAELRDVQTADYDFRVRARTAFAVSLWQSKAPVSILGLGAAPADVSGLNVQVMSDNEARVTWDAHADLDVIYGGEIVFRHSPKTSGVAWTDGIEIGRAPGGLTETRLPNLPGTYVARAFDKLGNPSADIATFYSDGDGARNWTATATITESTGFSGTKTNTTVSSSKLTLSASQASGSYAFDHGGTGYTDLSSKTRCRSRAYVDAAVVTISGLIDDRTDNIDTWESVDGTDNAGATAWLEVRTTDDDPSGSPTWSEWRRFEVAEFNARAFQLRAQLRQTEADHNIEISTLVVYLETPDT